MTKYRRWGSKSSLLAKLGASVCFGALSLCVSWPVIGSECGQAAEKVLALAGTGVEVDRLARSALDACLPLAESGNAEAAYHVGALYLSNLGNIKPDAKKAVRWLRFAAEKGFGPAQWYLAVLYEDGVYIAGDQKAAAYWYARAAEQGIAR